VKLDACPRGVRSVYDPPKMSELPKWSEALLDWAGSAASDVREPSFLAPPGGIG
jgi:hypothetical protein